MKQYYIYKIICLCGDWNGKFYIGKHYGDIHDSYAGSGKLIKEYFKIFDKIENVTYEKQIIAISDEISICDLEREYIREGMQSELCLNLHCVSCSGSLNKSWKLSNETRTKMSNAQKGRTYSAETLKRMSEGQRKRKGPTAGMYGKKHSEESKMKMSIAAKNRKRKS